MAWRQQFKPLRPTRLLQIKYKENGHDYVYDVGFYLLTWELSEKVKHSQILIWIYLEICAWWNITLWRCVWGSLRRTSAGNKEETHFIRTDVWCWWVRKLRDRMREESLKAGRMQRVRRDIGAEGKKHCRASCRLVLVDGYHIHCRVTQTHACYSVRFYWIWKCAIVCVGRRMCVWFRQLAVHRGLCLSELEAVIW